jgi:crotonobetainyl-CoA:carnitine CoA-transferase CaiB-like acyl-CoA transferase
VQTAQEVFDDPHVATRRLLIDVPDPVLGSVKLVGPVPKLSESTDPVACPAPLLGQHNEEVLGELLGYTKEDVAALKAEGVI